MSTNPPVFKLMPTMLELFGQIQKPGSYHALDTLSKASGAPLAPIGQHIIAIGPDGGKIIGYTAGGKPIYFNGNLHAALGKTKASHDEELKKTGTSDSLSVAQIVKDWLAKIGIVAKATSSAAGGAVGLSPTDAKVVEDAFGIKGVQLGHDLIAFKSAQFKDVVGKPLGPAPDKKIVTAAQLAAGKFGADAPFSAAFIAKTKDLGALGGSHGGKLAQGPDGEKLAWKPAHGGIWVARAEEVFNRVAKLVFPKPELYPEAQVVEKDHQPGVLLSWVENVGKLGEEGAGHSVETSALQKHFLRLAQHQVLDWLMGNHDSHGANFVVTPDGDVGAIDKGQAFKAIGKDTLSPSYKLNASSPVYNAMWDQLAEGKLKVDQKDIIAAVAQVVANVDAMPMDQYHLIVQPYLEELPAPTAAKGAAEAMAKWAAIEARKNSLKSDFEKFLSERFGKQVSLAKVAPAAQEVAAPPPQPPGAFPLAQTPAWKPVTKGKQTLLHPGAPPPPGVTWSTKYPGPGFATSIEVSSKKAQKTGTFVFAFQVSAQGKPEVAIALPDGQVYVAPSFQDASEVPFLWLNGLPLDMSKADKAKNGIAKNAIEFFGLKTFAAELAQSAVASVSDASVAQIDAGAKVLGQKLKHELSAVDLIAAEPDGVIHNQAALPPVVKDFLAAAPLGNVNSQWSHSLVPGVAFKMTLGAEPVLYAASPDGSVWSFVPKEDGSYAAPQPATDLQKFDGPNVDPELSAIKDAHTIPVYVTPQEVPIPADTKAGGGEPVGLLPGQVHTIKKKGLGEMTLESLSDGTFKTTIKGQVSTHKSIAAASDHVWAVAKGYESAADYKAKTGNKTVPSGGGWKFWGLKPQTGKPKAPAAPSAPTKPVIVPAEHPSAKPGEYPPLPWSNMKVVTPGDLAGMPDGAVVRDMDGMLYAKALGAWFPASQEEPLTDMQLSQQGSLSIHSYPGSPHWGGYKKLTAQDLDALPVATTLEDATGGWAWTKVLSGKWENDDGEIGTPPAGTAFKISATTLKPPPLKDSTLPAWKTAAAVVPLMNAPKASGAPQGPVPLVGEAAKASMPYEAHAFVDKVTELVSSGGKNQNGQLYWSKSILQPPWVPPPGVFLAGQHPTTGEKFWVTVMSSGYTDAEAALPLAVTGIVQSPSGVLKWGSGTHPVSPELAFTQLMAGLFPNDIEMSGFHAVSKVLGLGTASYPANMVATDVAKLPPAAESANTKPVSDMAPALKQTLVTKNVPLGEALTQKSVTAEHGLSIKITKAPPGKWGDHQWYLNTTEAGTGGYGGKSATLSNEEVATKLHVLLGKHGIQPSALTKPPAPSKGMGAYAVISDAQLKKSVATIMTAHEAASTAPNHPQLEPTPQLPVGTLLTKPEHFDAAPVGTFLKSNGFPNMAVMLKGEGGQWFTAHKITGVAASPVTSSGLAGVGGWTTIADPMATPKSAVVTVPMATLGAAIFPEKFIATDNQFYIQTVLAKLPVGTTLTMPSGTAYTLTPTGWASPLYKHGVTLTLPGLASIVKTAGATVTLPGDAPPSLKPAVQAPSPLSEAQLKKQKSIAEAHAKKTKEYLAWAKTHPQPKDHDDLSVLAHFAAKVPDVAKAGLYVHEFDGEYLIGSPETKKLQAKLSKLVASHTVEETPLGTMFVVPKKVLADAMPLASKTIEGPDGQTYPFGTTFKVEPQKLNVAEEVKKWPGFAKETAHTNASLAATHVALKFNDPTDAHVEEIKAKLAAIPGGKELFVAKGSTYVVVTNVPKSFLTQTIDGPPKVTPDVPPQPPPFVQKSAPFSFGPQAFGSIAQANRSDLAHAHAIDFGAWGHTIRMGDPGVLRGCQVKIKRVKDQAGVENFEIHGELQKFDPIEAKLGTGSLSIGLQGHGLHAYDPKTKTHKLVLHQGYGGFSGSLPNGASFQIAHGQSEAAFEHVFCARIPVGEDLEENLAKLFALAGVDAQKAMADHAADPALERKFVKAQIVRNRIGSGGYTAKDAFGKKLDRASYGDEAWLDKHLSHFNAHKDVDAAKIEVTAGGAHSVVLPDAVTPHAIAQAGVKFLSIGTDNIAWYGKHLAQGQGIPGRKQGYLNGTQAPGASASKDIAVGAQGVFTRVWTPGMEGMWGNAGSREYRYIIHPRVLNRVDSYFSPGDAFGNTTAHGHHPVPSNAMTEPLSAVSSLNEFTVEHGIPIRDLAGIATAGPTHRQKILDSIKAADPTMTHVNGIPIEDFVFVAGDGGQISGKQVVAKCHGLKPGVLP